MVSNRDQLKMRKDLKVAVVGDPGVGKSSLVSLMVKGSTEKMGALQFAQQIKVNTKDNLLVTLNVWDTTAMKEYDRRRIQAYSGCSVVLICLSIELAMLLSKGLNRWLGEARQYCPRAAVVLVGCKSDTRNQGGFISSKQGPICKGSAVQIAKKCRSSYIECSAMKNEGIREVIETVVQTNIKFKKKRLGCTIC